MDHSASHSPNTSVYRLSDGVGGGILNRRDMLAGSVALGALVSMGRSAISDPNVELYVPPEEAPHDRTFMQWPVSRIVHPENDFLEHLQHTIADIANATAAFEPVVMLAAKEHHARARKYLSQSVTLWDIPTEDLWCRDSGPLFAKKLNGSLAISHIQFNGWGNKQVHKHDGQIAAKVAERLGLELIPSGLHGEAGGVEHDGHGLLMAHKSSWLNDNRNPGLSLNDIERRLLAAYGGDKMIWSPGVMGEDITDYHIDSLVRFTGLERVLMNLPDIPDKSDPFHMAAMDMRDRLVDAGVEMDVIPEPEQRRIKDIDFVASYANYYACNGGIIAAQFGDLETDAIAIEMLEEHYPNREIVMLNVDALGEIGGGIHCATQQMPAV